MFQKKIRLLVASLFLTSVTVFAQQAFVATASDGESLLGASAGITVGQIAVETSSASSGTVFLGIRQDFSGEVSAIATNPIQNEVVKTGDSPEQINLSNYFMSNETLTFSASSSDESVAMPMVDGDNLTLVFGVAGKATIVVEATSPSGEKMYVSFVVTVDSDEPSYSNAKEHLAALCDEAASLLALVDNPFDLTMREYIPYTALERASNQSREALLDESTTNGDYEKLVVQMKQAIEDFEKNVVKTDISEIENEPNISVKERTIYVTNLVCGELDLYDIAGKHLYSCRNALNTQIKVPMVGVYVLLVCGKQHNIVIR